jgi:hypothetical protein
MNAYDDYNYIHERRIIVYRFVSILHRLGLVPDYPSFNIIRQNTQFGSSFDLYCGICHLFGL